MVSISTVPTERCQVYSASLQRAHRAGNRALPGRGAFGGVGWSVRDGEDHDESGAARKSCFKWPASSGSIWVVLWVTLSRGSDHGHVFPAQQSPGLPACTCHIKVLMPKSQPW